MTIQLPEIKNNDLVLLSVAGLHSYTKMFYSDGRVAKTDLVINKLDAELEKVQVPEEEMERIKSGVLKYFSGRSLNLIEGEINHEISNYRKRKLIEAAVSDGRLSEVAKVFGSDPGHLSELENTILGSYTPLTIFGCQPAGIQEANVLSFSILSQRIDFHNNKYEIILPHLREFNDKYLPVPTQNLSKVMVGAKEIRQYLADPAFKPLLDSGIIPEE